MNASKSPEEWRDRLAAQGWRPETFLVMAQLFCQLANRLTPAVLTSAGKRLQSDAFKTTDWDRAYTTVPRVMGQIVSSLDPALTGEAPAHEPAWGSWLRDTFTRIEATMKRLDTLTDPKTGYFTDEAIQSPALKAVVAHAEQQADSMVVELKAVADNLASLIQTGKPMSEWLKTAQAGDAQALLLVLSMNPWLSYHPGIARRVQQVMAAQDSVLIHRVAQAMEHAPRPNKHATAGLILMTLWEAGLKRLTYKQIRGFLKAVGLQGLPTHQALERYGQRLGLHKYVRETELARGARDSAPGNGHVGGVTHEDQ